MDNPEDDESYDDEFDDPPKILESASGPAQCLNGRRKMKEGLKLGSQRLLWYKKFNLIRGTIEMCHFDLNVGTGLAFEM